MADIKNYGLSGVSSNVQLGKGGLRLKANAAALEFRDTNDENFVVIKAANAVALEDVVTKAQLDAQISTVSTNVSSITGFSVSLGDIVTEGDGSWSPGAVSLTDDVKVSSAIDSLNEILALLVPSQPPAFPSGSISISNDSGNSPRLASGVSDNSGDSGLSAGDVVTRLNNNNPQTNTLNDRGPGDSGTVQLLLNGTVVGSRELTGSGDNGTYGGLQISGQGAFPSDTPGFWVSIDTRVNGPATQAGINKVQLNHTEGSATNEVYFVKDDLTSAPAVSSGSVAENVIGTVAHSSSVPHYDSGASLTVGLSISNLAGETYYGGSNPLVISSTNGIISNDTLNYPAIGITTPIARQTLAPTAITPITVNIDGNNVHNVGRIRAQARNVVGASSTVNVSDTDILVMRGNSGSRISELNIPVSGLGSLPNNNNGVRVLSGEGDTPSTANGDWTASAALPAHEAAVVAGVLSHNTTDYSTGYLPVGPDLSVGRNGAQYATFSFNRSSVSTFRIVVSGSYAGVWVKLPGVSDNAGISPNAANGWWNAFAPYDGAGVPGESGDAAAGCALGTVMTGSSGTFTMTFGTQTSSNSTGNQILVRFRLNSGQSITALSFTN